MESNAEQPSWLRLPHLTIQVLHLLTHFCLLTCLGSAAEERGRTILLGHTTSLLSSSSRSSTTFSWMAGSLSASLAAPWNENWTLGLSRKSS